MKKNIIVGTENRVVLTVDKAKSALIDLVPQMTGIEDKYCLVEGYINLLDGRYMPVQTLDYLNLAMTGKWQLLFSTNLMSRPNLQLRLREMVQQIETDDLEGKLKNVARWDYAKGKDDNDKVAGEVVFYSNSTFAIKCLYSISIEQ